MDEEISAEPFTTHLLAAVKAVRPVTVVKILLWAALYYCAVQVEFGVVYFVVSILVFVYLSMGSDDGKEKTGSAYSVFNKGQALPGTFSTAGLEASFGLPQYGKND